MVCDGVFENSAWSLLSDEPDVIKFKLELKAQKKREESEFKVKELEILHEMKLRELELGYIGNQQLKMTRCDKTPLG